MIYLRDYQLNHIARMKDALRDNSVIIDTSQTGAGKTIVALELAKFMISRYKINHILILCPPILIPMWEKNCKICELKEKVVILSHFCIKRYKEEMQKYFFLIVDECHYFKNQVTRTCQLQSLSDKAFRVLLLSATPFDDVRQMPTVSKTFKVTDSECLQNFSSICFKMDVKYPSKTTLRFCHTVFKTLEEEELYAQSRKLFGYAQKNNDEGFNAACFSKGIGYLHDSLFGSLLRYVEQKFVEKVNLKIVVVLRYIKHFDAFKEKFPNSLILSGQTPMSMREEIVEKFQKENLEHRIICISGDVGGVGIEVDDKVGIFRREIVMLPTTSATTFFQIIGRIHRINTQSDSNVTVIQACREKTYFTSQMERKLKVMSAFLTVPSFRHFYEEHKCKIDIHTYLLAREILPTEILKYIISFGCCCNSTFLNLTGKKARKCIPNFT